MTIDFPNIKPSSLNFSPATYNIAIPIFRDVVVSPRLLASKPNGAVLTMSFRAISADKILSIFNAWELSYSGFYELMLPSEITSSINSTNFAARVSNQYLFTWRFVSEPVLSNVTAGVGDVAVELRGELDGNVKPPIAWAQQLSTATGVTYNYEWEQLLTDTKGNLYHVILVQINSVNSFKVSKFSKNGTLLWSKHYNKVSGFGNTPSRAFNYSWTAKVGPQGLIIVAGQTSNVTSSSNLSACNKVICINTNTGLVNWAKAVTAVEASSSFSHFFASVHVNNNTGHTYIVSQISNTTGFSVVTLDSNGEVTGSIKSSFYNCNTLTTNGGNSLSDGSMVIVGNYLRLAADSLLYRGGFYIILNASGSVKQSIRILGETSNINTAFQFQSHPLAAVISNSNILWVGDKGILEFNPDMSYITSYQSLTNAIDISERSDGSFAVLSRQITPIGPSPSRHRDGWCTASLKILNSNRSQITGIKEIFLGNNPVITSRLDGTTNNTDRYVFIPNNSKTLISITSALNSWETQIEPLTHENGALTVRTSTIGLPASIPTLTNPNIVNPNFSHSTNSTIISDYAGSVTIDNPSDSWTLYSLPG